MAAPCPAADEHGALAKAGGKISPSREVRSLRRRHQCCIFNGTLDGRNVDCIDERGEMSASLNVYALFDESAGK